MADVCLILEGTYPYVTGGVSSWIHNLIRALPRVRFSLLTILPSRETYPEYTYEVPENVVSVSETYIHAYTISERRNRGSAKEAFALLARFYRDIARHDYSLLPEVFRLVVDPDTRVISPRELFSHRKTWDMLVAAYEAMELEDSFIDFFWTWRYSHLPLLRLADARIPRASVYHAVSTGYAGLLAAMGHLKNGAPVLLTEHGIYANERRIEIEQARWIYERRVDSAVITSTVSPFKQMWITLFEHMSRITYQYADEIITLFDNNRRIQIAGGADPRRTRVIPNGINPRDFAARRQPKEPGEKFRVGFLGRVVSIKDVKTFIRACKIVHDRFPDARFPIMGPTDGEPEYFEQCRAMVGMLALEHCVEFLGQVDARQQYPRLDVVVLTSVSEAQPLVILEANISGVPCVATDVGACSELLNGRTPEDRTLGPSGLVTPIADPEATAAAIIELLGDDERRWRMGQNGVKRVERFYNEQDLNFAYLDLYRQYIAAGEARKRQREAAWRA
jgi:glycosyltransferase involved in cell wall biosynthesis